MSRERRFTDPLTGDELTSAEHISWLVQGFIRRWTLLIAITVVTAIIFAWVAVSSGAALHQPGSLSLLQWWNLWASWAALMIEGTVGIAMFSSNRRDQVIIRRIDRNDRHLCIILDHLAEKEGLQIPDLERGS